MTGKELIELYELGKRNFPKTDLSGADLAAANLREVDLESAILTGAVLTGADLSAANLAEALLTHANLDEANLERTNLRGADLEGARLCGANLHGALARGTRLVGADLSRANLRASDLTGAQLEGARLSETDLQEVRLQQATLSGVDLRGGRLTDADLRAASLAGADLTGATLVGARLSGAKLAGTRLNGADLAYTLFNNADLTNADLTGAQLEGARFDGAQLRGLVWEHGMSELKERRPAELHQVSDPRGLMANRPPEVMLGSKPGLFLYFHTPLSSLDRLLVESVVAAFVQMSTDTDCRVAELVEPRVGVLHLESSRAASLSQLAELLQQRVWEQDSQHPLVRGLAGQGLDRLPALSFLMDRRDRFELWTGRERRLVKDREWTGKPLPKLVFCHLLAVLFTPDELRRTFGPLMPHPVPKLGVPHDNLVLVVFQSLEQRGLLARQLFLELILGRPERAPDILFVARQFGIDLSSPARPGRPRTPG